MKNAFFNDKVTQLNFDCIEDSRGLLVPVEFESLDFQPVRSFLITGRNGVTRGGHAHRHGKQLLIRISGDIQVNLSLDGEERSIMLNRDSNAVKIDAPVWASQTYWGNEPSLIVFSDHPFDPSDYIVNPQ